MPNEPLPSPLPALSVCGVKMTATDRLLSRTANRLRLVALGACFHRALLVLAAVAAGALLGSRLLGLFPAGWVRFELLLVVPVVALATLKLIRTSTVAPGVSEEAAIVNGMRPTSWNPANSTSFVATTAPPARFALMPQLALLG